MKKILILLIMIFSLTGCKDYIEINDLAILTGIVIDYTDDMYEVTAQLIVNDKKSNTKVFTTKSSSINEAIAELSKLSNKEVFISHLKVLIVTDNIIKNNIDFVIEHYNPNELLKLINTQSQKSENFDTTKGYGICEYNKLQANIYLQNGCTHNCSFCKSNYLKCELMDMPIEKVKRFIDEMDEEKVKYIQLRGLNLAQYGLGLYR